MTPQEELELKKLKAVNEELKRQLTFLLRIVGPVPKTELEICNIISEIVKVFSKSV